MGAAKSVEEARSLDLADRYLYTKATRFFLRADNVPEARKIESVYTKVIHKHAHIHLRKHS